MMGNMSETGKSNFESFLKHISANVRVKFHTQSRVGSSSSRANKVKKPYIGLRDIWFAYKAWSCNAVGVPLTLSRDTDQYYVPTLSAIQIFTKKPLVDGSSSTRSFGEDCHLYFEYNETMSFDARPPLYISIEELAKKHHGLNSLKSSDLTENSWFSLIWSPVLQIPPVQPVNAYFLTYHSFTPVFPETFSKETKVELPAFGVVGSKLSAKVWIMPETSDQDNLNKHEESAASWLGQLRFSHSDFDLFMAEKFKDTPFPSGVVCGKW